MLCAWRRWQLVPALFAACLSATSLSPILPALLTSLSHAVAALALALSAALVVIMPMGFRFRARGPFPTALRVLLVQDGALEFNLRVYYPAPSGARVEPRPYLLHGPETAQGVAFFSKVPEVIMSHLPALTVPLAVDEAAARAPFRGGKLPVLFFSHGLGGTPDLCERTAAGAAWVRVRVCVTCLRGAGRRRHHP